ncbi:hypothetical protein [Sphingomonas phyllosphaerae]|uniref:hypothetical protein n=1 Tax=Sphingomonas phyllosphaerae TaxID=257003 RepID=UPI0004015C42|nr:hypothetical protein [Sphingomonas phyllosphaerae]
MTTEAGGREARSPLVLRTIYALCLLGATYNHWVIIVRHELLWDYDGLPVVSAIFWTSLAFLDPAAVLLLWRRPRAGVAATMAIIVVDVIHNLSIMALYYPPLSRTLLETPGVIAQIVFMVFVLGTARIATPRGERANG